MTQLRELEAPLAITMWDFTWLMRHQPGDDFADLEGRLDELVARGYNALRIDCFPHLVAADRRGRIQDSFFHARDNLSYVPWGNQFSITTRPRESLVNFLRLCRERDLHIGLSTWLGAHGIDRSREVEGVDDFVRIWHETLTFLNDQGLLDAVIYVDLLNEYPLWHGFSWLHNQLQELADPDESTEVDLSKVHEQKVLEGLTTKKKFNDRQITFYNQVLNETISKLQASWPDIDFFASVTQAFDTPWQDIDFSQSAILDFHIWFVHHRAFSLQTGYFKDIHPRNHDQNYAACYERIRQFWKAEKSSMIEWMDGAMAEAADFAKSHNLLIGNTEGWGPILWMEHPHLDWDWVKESGEICAGLAVKNGYDFICTSNFTHPQFPGIWNDLDWHQRVTRIIRNG